MSILENLSRTFPEEQAKSIVRALEEFEAEKQHVTKEQLDAALKLQTAEMNAALKLQTAELNASIKKVEGDMTLSIKKVETDMKEMEIRLIKWVIGLMIAQTSITIAVLKMMGH